MDLPALPAGDADGRARGHAGPLAPAAVQARARVRAAAGRRARWVAHPAAPAPAGHPLWLRPRRTTAMRRRARRWSKSLLGLVEEKTGYPRDMVGLEQNLEADLGIDSIKRIEVVGACCRRCPNAMAQRRWPRTAAVESTQPTCGGMLELMTSAKPSAGGRRDRFAICAWTRCQSLPEATAVRADVPAQNQSAENAARRLTPVASCRHRRSPRRRRRLTRRCGRGMSEVAIVDPATLADEDRIAARWCAAFARQRRSPASIHLAPLRFDAVAADGSPALMAQAIRDNEKSLFLLLRELGRHGPTGARGRGQRLGGLFGRDRQRRRRPDACRAAASAWSVAAQGTHRVPRQGGRPGSVATGGGGRARTCCRNSNSTADRTRSRLSRRRALRVPHRRRGRRHRCGARSRARRTWSCSPPAARRHHRRGARELARPGNVLVLTGRSDLPDGEPPNRGAGRRALRAHFVARCVRARRR